MLKLWAAPSTLHAWKCPLLMPVYLRISLIIRIYLWVAQIPYVQVRCKFAKQWNGLVPSILRSSESCGMWLCMFTMTFPIFFLPLSCLSSSYPVSKATSITCIYHREGVAPHASPFTRSMIVFFQGQGMGGQWLFVFSTPINKTSGSFWQWLWAGRRG